MYQERISSSSIPKAAIVYRGKKADDFFHITREDDFQGGKVGLDVGKVAEMRVHKRSDVKQ